jgi:hypothetical protein
VAEAAEAGMGLLTGAVRTEPDGGKPRDDSGKPRDDSGKPRDTADRVRTLWRRLGLPPATAATTVITPACGLAGVSPAQAREALARCREAARILTEMTGGE